MLWSHWRGRGSTRCERTENATDAHPKRSSSSRRDRFNRRLELALPFWPVCPPRRLQSESTMVTFLRCIAFAEPAKTLLEPRCAPASRAKVPRRFPHSGGSAAVIQLSGAEYIRRFLWGLPSGMKDRQEDRHGACATTLEEFIGLGRAKWRSRSKAKKLKTLYIEGKAATLGCFSKKARSGQPASVGCSPR